MFGRTKKKIVLAIMAAVLMFLAVTLAAIYGTSYLSIKKQYAEMLDRYVSMYSLDSPPGAQMPDPPGPVPDETSDENAQGLPELPDDFAVDAPPLVDGTLYQLSSFYSVAFSESGEALAIDVGESDVYDEGDISAFASEILSEQNSSGIVNRLMYRVEERDGYTLVAFMDMTLVSDNMATLLRNTLIAGVLSACVLFAIAVFLAHVIIKPLEENYRNQKKFISDAEHELKTPITVISANTDLLKRQLGPNEWLGNIQYENERMADLVNRLLELSRAENSAGQSEKINFSKLVEQEVLPFESVAYEQGMSIDMHIAENISVNGNHRELGQLVSILTDNAISHGKGTVIYVELAKEHKFAVLKVKNEGDEISEEVREHLFDRFFRMDEARGENGGHYGLGLAIARAIVDAHKGRIRMDCEDGMVIVTVHLPQSQG